MGKTPAEKAQPEKALAVVKDEVPEKLQRLSDLDFQKLFQFKEHEIILGETEAWTMSDDGTGPVMPFGKGARRLAVAMGVEFLLPEKIFVEGDWHSNPYILFKAGRAVGIYIIKHGIAIAGEGIRYLQPVLDFIDLDAVIASMAINTQERVVKKSQDAAKNCTRKVFEGMQANWKKPGDPDWMFVPTLDNDTGIAFNLSEPPGSTSGYHIRKLVKDISALRRNPLRKLHTATDRLVFEKLFPEALTAYDQNSVKVVKEDYATKVKQVTFRVMVPTAAPIARQMLMEFGVALRDNDPDARERKFHEIMRVLGGTVPIKQIAASTMDAGEIAEDYKDAEQIDESLRLKPVPANPTSKVFKEYWKTEFRKLDDKQKAKILELSGCASWDTFKLTKENFEKIVGYFMELAGIAPASGATEPTPDDMRKFLLDQIAEHDGNVPSLDAAMKANGIGADTDFTLIPDVTVKAIYDQFTKSLKQETINGNATNGNPA